MAISQSLTSNKACRTKFTPAQLAIGIFLLLVGVILAAGAFKFPVDKGYSVLGPHVFPMAVAVYMVLIGTILCWQAFTGGFRNLEQSKDRSLDEIRVGRAGAAWVSAGILANALLISHIGFVLASSVLFMLAARGFGSKRPSLDLAIGLGLTLPIFWLFTAGLGLSLPSIAGGWL